MVNIVNCKSFVTSLAPALSCAFALSLVSATARAEEAMSTAAAAPAKDESRPRVHHAPITSVAAGERLLVSANIDHPELVKRLLFVYSTEHAPSLREVPFLRGSSAYVAEVPADEMKPSWLDYAIEVELLDGSREAVFASRRALHRVSVPEELMEARERALYERLGGRRSVFSASADYVDFGQSHAQVSDGLGNITNQNVRDHYFRIEGGYTYRPLRLVTEFSLRAGVVRGLSPVPIADGSGQQGNRDPFAVGLNYGAPSVRLRLADVCHLEGEFLTSVTEQGFSLGAGAAVLIGDPYGSKLTLGFESIKTFGTRFWSRMDIPANRWLLFSPMIEIADTPHADKFGVRLLGELGVDVGSGFVVAVRGGYQARVYTEGGASAGGTVSYAF
jgi:hypothetical protein